MRDMAKMLLMKYQEIRTNVQTDNAAVLMVTGDNFFILHKNFCGHSSEHLLFFLSDHNTYLY